MLKGYQVFYAQEPHLPVLAIPAVNSDKDPILFFLAQPQYALTYSRSGKINIRI